MKPDKDRENSPPGWVDRAILHIGNAGAWLIAVLIAAILVQVILRYVFQQSFVTLEELQWHFYAVIIMLGLSYAFIKDSHIRLDILHSRFSKPTKEKIEIMGIICLLWPMIFVFFMHSLDFVAESFRVGERSDAPMGLGFRWAIKSIIPIAFFLLFCGSLTRLTRAVLFLKHHKKNHGNSSHGS